MTTQSATTTQRSTHDDVRDRWLSFPGFTLAASGWDALGLPVDMAFLLPSSRSQDHVVAFSVGPTGPVEAELSPGSWGSLVAVHPGVSTLRLGREALLVRAPVEQGAPGAVQRRAPSRRRRPWRCPPPRR